MKQIIQNLLILSLCQFINSDDWTHTYKKKFTGSESEELSTKKSVIFEKDTLRYTQLVFSWNADRPKNGYFTFYVQPRDAATKKWGNWFLMSDWGKNVQRSHTNCEKPTNETCFIYVRLELPHSKKADGFRIKVETNGDVSLSFLKMISVCVSDFTTFDPDQIDNTILNLSSVKINGISKISQMALNHEHSKRICSPTSTCMLVSYLTKKNFDPIDFASQSFDNGLMAFGSWPFNTAHAFEVCPDYYFFVTRLKSFQELHSYLLKEIPVVVSVRGKMYSAPQEYNKGHLILIVGWDKDKKEVICHDPAFATHDEVFHKYPVNSFLKAWERSNRLAYIAQKRY